MTTTKKWAIGLGVLTLAGIAALVLWPGVETPPAVADVPPPGGTVDPGTRVDTTTQQTTQPPILRAPDRIAMSFQGRSIGLPLVPETNDDAEEHVRDGRGVTGILHGAPASFRAGVPR